MAGMDKITPMPCVMAFAISSFTVNNGCPPFIEPVYNHQATSGMKDLQV